MIPIGKIKKDLEYSGNLKEVIEGWIVISIKKGLPIPQLGDLMVEDVKITAI